MNFCQDYNVLHVIFIVKRIINIAKLAIPLLLMFFIIIDISKIVTNPENLKKKRDTIIKRLIAAFLVFFVPTFVSILTNGLPNNPGDNWKTCYDNADNYDSFNDEEEKKATGNAQRKKLLSKEINNRILKIIRVEADEKEYQDILKISSGDSSAVSGPLNGENYNSVMQRISTPSIDQIKSAAEKAGVDDSYLKVVIGTTYNEGYFNDPFLFYGWASAMINQPVSVDYMVAHWGGSYYGWENINKGYSYALSNEKVMKSVYLALTNRNTNIVECHGMGSSQKSIYDSKIYNCSVYEKR